ncbi:WecB/TagA/CpsF family glycosyltransferase [Stenotrophomonas indicatrix]|uniref:WecB/TagA/CpsF family glycosyltransferase n=1 Tax=Stenotrophomonas indicatrix TaxID=2045451 RepID=UPI003208B539
MSKKTPPRRVFGIAVDLLTLEEAAAAICEECVSTTSFKYVVTPNIDHVVNLRTNAKFRRAYSQAAYALADGWPVVAACRMLRHSVPERVAGSDLVPAVLAHADRLGLPLAVFVLGGLGDVPERAADHIRRNYPSLKVVGAYSPPIGFEKDAAQSSAIVSMINKAQANFIILGLGAPKQENWIHDHSALLDPGVAICAGATVDFMAGNVRRAPPWMAKVGLEWLHRLTSDPRRLFGRYAKDAVVFPLMFLQEAWRFHRRDS